MQTSKFQLVFFGLLIIAIIGGVGLFSYSSRKGGEVAVRVQVWGTVDDSLFKDFVNKLKDESNSDITVLYTQKEKSAFEADLAEAIATGKGPDIILLPQDLILKQQDKVVTIPFKSYSERAFKDTFIEEGELYLTQNGAVALPFSVDPMITFWNRNLFSSAGIARPPTTWDGLYPLVETFTKKDNAANILQTTIALGEYTNIQHAKDLMALLLIQAGNPIVSKDRNGDYTSQLGNSLGYTVRPADSAVNFYTQFADPLRSIYSWNRSLPESKDMFISGDTAMYIGYASEIPEIRRKNPNLNFDIAAVLQARGAKSKVTYGTMQGFAILRSSRDIEGSMKAISYLTSPAGIKTWSTMTLLPPVRRDLLSERPTDSVNAVLYDSALWARSWSDPDRVKTAAIFRSLIEGVTSGRTQISEGIQKADQELSNTLKPYNDVR